MKTTTEEQIREVKRELAVRKRVLPTWIGRRITADQCRHRIEVMEDLLKLLLAKHHEERTRRLPSESHIPLFNEDF